MALWYRRHICCFFVIVSYFIATGVVDPVSKVVQLANAIAGGDLTQRLDMTRQDELGDMAGALDDSCTNLTGMIKEIKTNADTLAISAGEMSTVSTQLASSAEEMTSQCGTVAGQPSRCLQASIQWHLHPKR